MGLADTRAKRVGGGGLVDRFGLIARGHGRGPGGGLGRMARGPGRGRAGAKAAAGKLRRPGTRTGRKVAASQLDRRSR